MKGNTSNGRTPAGMFDGPPRVTPEMQEAGAKALAARYHAVAIVASNPASPVLFTSESALGIAAATAFLAMEPLNQRGDRDHLQHPGLFGGMCPEEWVSMTPEQRAVRIHEEAPEFLMGLSHSVRLLAAGNPVLGAVSAMVACALVGAAQDLKRAAAVRRRAPAERREAQRLRDAALDAEAVERRKAHNEARKERRRRARAASGKAVAS